jgi:hypothetical protein
MRFELDCPVCTRMVLYPYPSDPSQRLCLRPGNPLSASEFYAHALEVRLDLVIITAPSSDVLQALFMLGFHNWFGELGVARSCYKVSIIRCGPKNVSC